MNGNDDVLKSMLSASTRTVNSDYYDIHVVASFHVSWAKKSSEWDVLSALVGQKSSHIITIRSLHNDETEFWYIGKFFNLLLRNFSLDSRREEWGALITSKEFSMRIKAVHFRVSIMCMGKNEKKRERERVTYWLSEAWRASWNYVVLTWIPARARHRRWWCIESDGFLCEIFPFLWDIEKTSQRVQMAEPTWRALSLSRAPRR